MIARHQMAMRSAGIGQRTVLRHPALRSGAQCLGAPRALAAPQAASTTPATPSPAETARTIVEIGSEAVLCVLGCGGAPLGAPVAYALDASGQPLLRLAQGSPEAAALAADARACLLVQPSAFPARGVAAVALQGTVTPLDGDAGAALSAGSSSSSTAISSSSSSSSSGSGSSTDGSSGSANGSASDVSGSIVAFQLQVDSCTYYGGLDNSGVGQAVSGDEYRAAEPDALRGAAGGLIGVWNSDRAEDIYRIVATHLGVPLVEMAYAELLWLDRLGMYIRAEVAGQASAVVRVPFYRPVLDERDARSVITMAAQLAWESERNYVPPLPAIFQDAANNN